MTTKELDAYFRSVLDIEGFKACDDSLNGIQVDNDGAAVEKIAFAVDACAESFRRAEEAGAGLLFVHHGLFWGARMRVSGLFRDRLQMLLRSNLALYAAHLPLDENAEFGNNIVLARLLGIKNPERFGEYHGKKIGFKGGLEKPLSVHEAAKRIQFASRPPAAVLPFGKELSQTCAVISGGAAMEAAQALDEGLDLYVTGEPAHAVYHTALEGKLNMVLGGHYATEVWGLQALAQKCAADLHIAVSFIDVPTGL